MYLNVVLIFFVYAIQSMRRITFNWYGSLAIILCLTILPLFSSKSHMCVVFYLHLSSRTYKSLLVTYFFAKRCTFMVVDCRSASAIFQETLSKPQKKNGRILCDVTEAKQIKAKAQQHITQTQRSNPTVPRTGWANVVERTPKGVAHCQKEGDGNERWPRGVIMTLLQSVKVRI